MRKEPNRMGKILGKFGIAEGIVEWFSNHSMLTFLVMNMCKIFLFIMCTKSLGVFYKKLHFDCKCIFKVIAYCIKNSRIFPILGCL